MSRNILLVLPDPAIAQGVRESLAHSRDGPFTTEWLSRCSDAVERLASAGGQIAAVVVDLFLPDSQGIETFDRLSRTASGVPILVVGRAGDEDVAREAVRRGAQDYLLAESLDGYSLPKALDSMLERFAHMEALLAERERAQVTLNSIGDAVVSTDVEGKVVYLNPVAESMTGWSRQEASGRPLLEVLRIIDADSREPALNPLAMAILYNKTVSLSENCLLISRDGREHAIEDTAAPIHDHRGQVSGAVIVFHDVSVARAMSARMAHLAQHDCLTGLPNRMLLGDRLSRAVASAERHRAPLAVLFLDVNRFKLINDAYGHAVGDQVLRSVARRLVASVRNSDTVCRIGGDEFVVLLAEVARAEDAASSADKIAAAMRPPHRIDHRELFVSLSVGIGLYPRDGRDAETLLKSADLALVRAKAQRRNQPSQTADENGRPWPAAAALARQRRRGTST
jgi:diguanylate cyclase (GGDEF)-like protein/PAS domain S-box-containing protein